MTSSKTASGESDDERLACDILVVGAGIVGLPLEIAGALLVFVAAFMISGGLQALTSRPIDVRTTFTISLALLLGLSTRIEPDYFRQLPDFIRYITSDMLTVSFLSAVLLTLLFRLGVRRREETQWRNTATAFDDFQVFIKKQATAWKLPDDTTERAIFAVSDIMEHLRQGNLLEEPIAFKADYDGIELKVELDYRGKVLNPVSSVDHHKNAIKQATAHEDAPATGGIHHFSQGGLADRSAISGRDGAVQIRLWFDA